MILGTDLSSQYFGYCAGVGDAIPVVDALAFKPVGQDYGALLVQLEDYLDIIVKRFGVTRVYNEGPMHRPKRKGMRGDTLHTMRLLYPMHSFLWWYCLREGLHYEEVSIGDLKAEVTGNRNADKDDMVPIARKCGLILPKGPGAKDATDGWGAWLIGLRKTDKRLSEAWDRRIYTPRGVLL